MINKENLKERIQMYLDCGFTESVARKSALDDIKLERKAKQKEERDRKARNMVFELATGGIEELGIHLHRYNGNFYKYNNETHTWHNYNDIVGSNQLQTIAQVLSTELKDTLKEKRHTDITATDSKAACLNTLSRIIGNDINIGERINPYQASFTNGIYDIKTEEFKPRESFDSEFIPFNPYQIRYEYNPNATKVEVVDNFFNSLNPDDPNTRKVVLQFIGSCLFPHNPSVFFILYSKHSTSGKGTIIEIIRKIVRSAGINTDKFFKNGNQFALSGLQDASAAYFNELPEHISKDINEKIKDLADSASIITIEKKGTNQQDVQNTHSWFATTNKILTVHNPESALKKRIIWTELTLNGNKDDSFKFDLNEINYLVNSKLALEYIIKLAVEEYQAIFGGSRNTNWALPKSNENFWLIPITENKAVDILLEMNEFDHLVTQKCSFVTNEHMNNILSAYKERYKHEKAFSLKAFKKSFIIYLEHTGHKAYIPANPKKVDGRSQRGIEIEWAE